MPYITGFERDGMRKATCDDVIEILQTRFETVPQELSSQLQKIKDLALLKQLLKQSITIPSLEHFRQLLSEILSQNPET